MVYHGFSIKWGGDPSVLDKDAWLAEWVALLKQVLASGVCKVSKTAFGSMLSIDVHDMYIYGHVHLLVRRVVAT